jgi:hypothetical protein
MNTSNLTETTVRQFVAFMKFIAENDLWEETEKHLRDHGCDTIVVSSEPIGHFRNLLKPKLADGTRLSPKATKQGTIIMDCGCGVSNPGPGRGPVTPPSSGGGGDGGPGDGGGGDGGGHEE